MTEGSTRVQSRKVLLYSAGLRQYRWNNQAYLLRLPQDRSRPGERQC
jgi:hypothetical protein